MKWIKLLFHPISLITIGSVALVLGIGLTWDGLANGMPEREKLEVVAGTVRDISRMANRTPTGASYNVRYELILAPAGKLVLTEKYLSDFKISQAEVQTLSGKQVEALITPERNYEIWEFTANGKKLLSYDADKESAARYYRTETTVGPRVAGIGFVLLVIGAIALRIGQSVRAARAHRAKY